MAELFAETLFAYLKSEPTLQELVGDRIYPVMRPQLGTEQRQPALTYRVASRKGGLLCGKQKDGRTESLVQFVAWAQSYATAKQIVKAIYDALESRHWAIGPQVPLLALDDEVDDYSDVTNEFFVALELRVTEIRQRT